MEHTHISLTAMNLHTTLLPPRPSSSSSSSPAIVPNLSLPLSSSQAEASLVSVWMLRDVTVEARVQRLLELSLNDKYPQIKVRLQLLSLSLCDSLYVSFSVRSLCCCATPLLSHSLVHHSQPLLSFSRFRLVSLFPVWSLLSLKHSSLS